MGDIDEQTVAGAISTGTHGTGGQRASLSAQVSGLELVTGKGELLQADARQNPDVLDVARLGLGALGILTAVTFDVEPMFTLEAHESPMLWDEGLDRFEELADRQPPLRDVLVPAHRAAADQAQQPHPRRPRAAVADASAGSTTSSSPTASSAGPTASATADPASYDGSTTSPAEP